MNPLKVVDSFESPVGRVSSNRLLAALPLIDYERLAADLTYRSLKPRQVIHKNGQRLTEVCFPDRSVCSITHTMDDGATVEVAMVGQEGMIGIGAALGDSIVIGDAIVHVSDGAHVMGIEAFQREMARRDAFHALMTRYAQAFVAMLAQSVACNGLHSAEERCCRWLLMTSDRLGRDDFRLTHEVLSVLLGLRRPTVTLVLAQLVKAGMIEQERGQVCIVDRRALEEASCECYRSMKAMFSRLLP